MRSPFAAPLVVAFLIVLASSCAPESRMTDEQRLRAAIDFGAEGRWEKAEATIRDVVKRSPKNVDALVMHALALEGCRDMESAFDQIRRAAKMAPSDFMAQYTLGRILFDCGRYADCISPLTIALGLRPNHPEVLALLARSAATLQLPEAKRHYVRLAKTDQYRDRPEAYNELGALLASDNKLRKAAKCFLKAYRLDPENPTVLLNLGVFCDERLDKPATAEKYYRQYLALTERNSELELKREEVRRRIKELASSR